MRLLRWTNDNTVGISKEKRTIPSLILVIVLLFLLHAIILMTLWSTLSLCSDIRGKSSMPIFFSAKHRTTVAHFLNNEVPASQETRYCEDVANSFTYPLSVLHSFRVGRLIRWRIQLFQELCFTRDFCSKCSLCVNRGICALSGICSFTGR